MEKARKVYNKMLRRVKKKKMNPSHPDYFEANLNRY